MRRRVMTSFVIASCLLVATNQPTLLAGASVQSRVEASQEPASTEVETSVKTTADTDAMGRIIPGPNSGHDPAYSGDRGTWAQYAVMIGIAAMLAAMILIARRQMKAGRSAGHAH